MAQHKTVTLGLVRIPERRIAEYANQRALGGAACGPFIGEQLKTYRVRCSFNAFKNIYFILKIVHLR